jgi:hypothetical protein
MADLNDWNASIIAEFRANAGKVGGSFANAPMVLITTRGARTANSAPTRWSAYPTATAW